MSSADALLNLTRDLGNPSIAPAVYDTSLVARLPSSEAPDQPAFPQSLRWLLDRQYGYGTWGSPVVYHHDRVLSTLSAMLALAQWRESGGALAEYSERIHAAAWGVAPHLLALPRDPQATPGFAELVDDLATEARFRGIPLSLPAGRGLDRRRTPRAGRPRVVEAPALPRPPTPPASSAARAAAHLLRHPDDRPTRTWLGDLVNSHAGAAPAEAQVSLLETGWVVVQLADLLTGRAPLGSQPPGGGTMPATLAGPLAPALRRLAEALTAPLTAAEEVDLATAALAFRALTWAGAAPDPASLLRFESDEHFRDAPPPAFPRSSAIGHALLLEALRAAPPFPGRDRAVRKAVGYLAQASSADHFWFDRRHASPLLPTALAVPALGPQLTLAHEAAQFLQRCQRPDGSWGYFDTGTAEETAYCVQALARFAAQGGPVRAEAIAAGRSWLAAGRARGDHPPLWIGRTLFTPRRMVEAAVLAAQ